MRIIPPIPRGGDAPCREGSFCPGKNNACLSCTRKTLARGEALLQVGGRLEALYSVRTGCFKADVVNDKAAAQVMGFYLRGELIGLDGIASGRHCSRVTALEESEVCVLPFPGIERACSADRAVHRRFLRAMAKEIVMRQNMLLVLGSMSTEERLAFFLLNLSARLLALGHSAADMRLRMSRAEIGSYVGSTLETVSRMLSRLQQQGLISVHGKHIRLLDEAGLRRLVGVGASGSVQQL